MTGQSGTATYAATDFIFSQYNGAFFDSATGLSYHNDPATGIAGRWYSADQQRWISQDPTDLTFGPNPYVPVENSPTNFTDPSGLCPWWVPTWMCPSSRLPTMPVGSYTAPSAAETNLEPPGFWRQKLNALGAGTMAVGRAVSPIRVDIDALAQNAVAQAAGLPPPNRPSTRPTVGQSLWNELHGLGAAVGFDAADLAADTAMRQTLAGLGLLPKPRPSFGELLNSGLNDTAYQLPGLLFGYGAYKLGAFGSSSGPAGEVAAGEPVAIEPPQTGMSVPRTTGGASGPQFGTWNEFQAGTAGQFASRAEAASAWEIYKDANGIVSGGTIRKPGSKSTVPEISRGRLSDPLMDEAMATRRVPAAGVRGRPYQAVVHRW